MKNLRYSDCGTIRHSLYFLLVGATLLLKELKRIDSMDTGYCISNSCIRKHIENCGRLQFIQWLGSFRNHGSMKIPIKPVKDSKIIWCFCPICKFYYQFHGLLGYRGHELLVCPYDYVLEKDGEYFPCQLDIFRKHYLNLTGILDDMKAIKEVRKREETEDKKHFESLVLIPY